MKTNPLLIATVVVVCAFVLSAQRRKASDELILPTGAARVEWLTDFKTAQQRALAENKPLLIDFTGSDWCPPCMILDRQVFSQPEFADYAAQNLILLKVDFPRRKPLSVEDQAENDALARRFAIRGFPTILAMGADGKLKGQVPTSLFNGPGGFIASLEQILRRS